MSHTTTTRQTTTTEYDEAGRIVRQLVVTVETVHEYTDGIDRTVYESHEWTSGSDVDRCARCFVAWDGVEDVCTEAE
jgi:YD repeat-containing protein